MKKLAAIILFFAGALSAQQDHFNVVVGMGPGFFLNDNSLKHHFDYCTLLGLNYVLSDKRQRISFNPGFSYTGNSFRTDLQDRRYMHVKQKTFSLSLDMLMKLSKKSFLRVGLFFSRIDYSDVFYSQRELSGRAYYSYGSDDLSKDYSSSSFQVGVTAGLCFPFKLFNKEHRFNIRLIQYGTSIVNSDYIINKDVVGVPVKILSQKGRPTQLLLSLEINLHRNKKKEKNKEEG